MAQRTTADETLPREELAAYFKDLAAEFERGDEEVTVPVGNKNVSLDPPQNIDLSVEVVERSSMLRGNRETVEIELSWKPQYGRRGLNPDLRAEFARGNDRYPCGRTAGVRPGRELRERGGDGADRRGCVGRYELLRRLGPLLGILLMLIVWVGVINWRYPGGWGSAVAIGFVAWIVAVGIVYLFAVVGLVTPDVLGIPGV